MLTHQEPNLEDIRRHDAHPITAVYITKNQLAQRYSVTPNTIGQWTKNRPNNFPQPLKFNGRNLWELVEIEAWDRAIIEVCRSQREERVPAISPAPYVQPAWARPKEEG